MNAASELIPKVVCNAGPARTCKAEVVALNGNDRIKLANVGNCLTRLLEWINLGKHALLNIFDSIVSKGGPGRGTPPTNPRLSITR